MAWINASLWLCAAVVVTSVAVPVLAQQPPVQVTMHHVAEVDPTGFQTTTPATQDVTGQAVGYAGTAMFNTLKDVNPDQRIELPVAEEFQMGVTTGLALQGYLPVLALVNHLRDEAVLVQGLVALAIENMLLEQIEELQRTAGAPNLYWALATLPRPMTNTSSARSSSISATTGSARSLWTPPTGSAAVPR